MYRTGHVAPCTTDGVLTTPLEGSAFSCIVVWTLPVGLCDGIANGRGPVDFFGIDVISVYAMIAASLELEDSL